MCSFTSLFFPGLEGVDTTVKVATETAKLSSRTSLGRFLGPFKTIFQGLKFNFSYYFFISFFVPNLRTILMLRKVPLAAFYDSLGKWLYYYAPENLQAIFQDF